MVLHADHSERDGFHLENVSNVLIRGFTVRDFGQKATTNTEWGEGNGNNRFDSNACDKANAAAACAASTPAVPTSSPAMR